MIAPLQTKEFAKLRDMIVNACGIYLEDDKDYLVESRLTDLGNELKAETFSDLHRLIISDSNKLMPRLIDLMTTNETYWFRDDSLWRALEKKIIPDFFDLLKNGKKREIKIWSAACSTGQEPFSLSLLIEEIGQQLGNSIYKDSFHILGTDISDEALLLARSGKANLFSVKRGLSEARLKKYFTQDGRVYILKEDITRRVEFKKLNLMDSFLLLGKFDLVLCRNVAIYFTNEFKKELFRKIARILLPDGILFIGASESLIGHSEEFKSDSYENAIYYHLK
jgi:chemotaxis protein methyltransferase CheR